MDIDRGLIRERIAACRAGQGMVKQATDFIQLCPDEQIHINFFLPKPGARAISLAHTHPIGFTSTVLFGSMINKRVTIVDDPEGDYNRFIIKNSDRGQKIDFTDTERRSLITAAGREVYGSGDTYSMDPREFHVTINELPTITYLRQWPEAEVESYVLFPLAGKQPERVERYVDPEELPGIWQQIDFWCERAGL